jgi:hypothetical protein
VHGIELIVALLLASTVRAGLARAINVHYAIVLVPGAPSGRVGVGHFGAANANETTRARRTVQPCQLPRGEHVRAPIGSEQSSDMGFLPLGPSASDSTASLACTTQNARALQAARDDQRLAMP